MGLIAFGINHKTAPLAIREQVAVAPEKLPHHLAEFVGKTSVNEAVILSTCNRTEYYCIPADDCAHHDWLPQIYPTKYQDILPNLYRHENDEAVKHILRVATGLDSMVLGEPQILGQMKKAFSVAQSTGTVGSHLIRLFQYVFATSKEVRTQTAINANPISLAYVAVNLAKSIFTQLSQRVALLIGAGETIELTGRYLLENGVKKIFIVNRHRDKATILAEKLGATVVTMEELPTYLTQSDIVIAATSSPLPLLGKGTVESALKTRKRQPMFMVDLAVPRDIEPEVADLQDVYLYNLDDLNDVIDEGLKSRKAAAIQAEEMINLGVNHYMRYLRSLDAVSMVCAYRQQMDIIREREVAKAMALLQKGCAPADVIEQLASALSNKFLHAPSVQLRQAGYEGNLELLEHAQKLLDINLDKN